MTKEKKRLIIIDSNAVIHRAYHALPHLTTQKGEANIGNKNSSSKGV
ncbi:unnamed protein product [marine sediment metagenome]|uniref:5'-3' exonuclease alpha-helical arch N-terminal domain-containing protein n=1 Tax=marine sediment metagenome TaxID=412755 RepID=X1R332_9ZZZZ